MYTASDNIIKSLPELRLYFLSQGFVCPNTEGIVYVRSYDSNKLIFEVNIQTRKMIITMPDFQYNMMYPQARRNRIIEYYLENEQGIIFAENLDNFLDKMFKTYESKGELK